MKQKEIIEGNKLIADSPFSTDGIKLAVKKDAEIYNRLQYHTSWDWLMPVVEKIEAFDCEHTDCRLTIERYECKMYFNTVGMVYEWSNGGTSKINSVWLSVIRFIKWYNQPHP